MWNLPYIITSSLLRQTSSILRTGGTCLVFWGTLRVRSTIAELWFYLCQNQKPGKKKECTSPSTGYVSISIIFSARSYRTDIVRSVYVDHFVHFLQQCCFMSKGTNLRNQLANLPQQLLSYESGGRTPLSLAPKSILLNTALSCCCSFSASHRTILRTNFPYHFFPVFIFIRTFGLLHLNKIKFGV